MEDPNVILALKADIFEKEHNGLGSIPSGHDHVLENVDDCSRETTPLGSEDVASIFLEFNRKPKQIGRGYTFGGDSTKCDVYLGRGSISGVHFSVTFDRQERIILRDSSTHGTAVLYGNEKSQGRRRNFTWILFPEFQPIKVRVGDSERKEVVITLELPTHGTCEAEYRANIASYVEDSTDAGPLLGFLGISSEATTAAPSALLSPRQRPQYHEIRLLGEGQFGIVHLAVDVSTGRFFALKTFLKGNWQREVKAMRYLSHEHIVQFMDIVTDPEPKMIIEYFPLGNLKDQHVHQPIFAEEGAAILVQGTDALTYLHKKQLAHRDIKPENILVKTRRPFQIKLSDFGLAKNVSELATCCGSYLYAAPEVFRGERYTAAVDIWSLGVVVYEYVYGLPKTEGTFSPNRWFKKLVGSILDWDADCMIDFLSSKMLKMNPQERSSAKHCHQCSLEIFGNEFNQKDPQRSSEDSSGGTCTPVVTESFQEIPRTEGNSVVSRGTAQDRRNTAKSRSRNSSGERCTSKRRRSVISSPQVTMGDSRRAVSPGPIEFGSIANVTQNSPNNRAKRSTEPLTQKTRYDKISHCPIENPADNADKLQRKSKYKDSPNNDSYMGWDRKRYSFVTFNDRKVYYRLYDGSVNATQIGYAANMKRTALLYYLKRMNVPQETVRGDRRVQGTFTGSQWALWLCDRKVPELKLILQQALQKHGFQTEQNQTGNDQSTAKAIGSRPRCCTYDTKKIARPSRVRIVKEDLPRNIAPKPVQHMATGEVLGITSEIYEEQDAETSVAGDKSSDDTNDSVAESSEGPLEGEFEKDGEEVSSYNEESPKAATERSRSSPQVKHQSRHLRSSQEKSQHSNFTEPSFLHGSFLPPLRDSILQRQDLKLQYPDIPSLGTVSDEDLWKDI